MCEKQVPKKKECSPDKKLNEKTNRCVKKEVPKKKECSPDKKLNEKTNRCVKAKATLKPVTPPKPTTKSVTKPANQEKKQQANQLKKRITFQSNNVGNVKWMKPTSRPSGTNPIVPLTQQKVNVFGSELIDNNWITEQYEYWKKLSEIDKLFLLVYTAYGDVLVNTFLLKGVNGQT
jgi:hypothetical protein